jgi:hypothetical protein
MRLIRIVSNTPADNSIIKSEFENNFLDNIVIPAKGKIGLLNVSVPINFRDIHITSANNEFQFSPVGHPPKAGQILTISLGADRYFTTDEFISFFCKSAWSALDFDPDAAGIAQIGFLINLSLTNRKFAITTYRKAREPLKTDDISATNSNCVVGGDITRQDQVGSGLNSFIVSKLPALTSCSVFQVKILTALLNMAIGLLNTPQADPTILQDTDFKYLFKLDNNGTPNYQYYYKDNTGAVVPVNVAIYPDSVPQVNDILAMNIRGGNLYYCIYRNNHLSTEILYGGMDAQTDTNFFGIGLRQTTVSVSIPQVMYDPRYQVNGDGDILYQELTASLYRGAELNGNEGLDTIPSSTGNLPNTYMWFNFSKPVLRDLLGFDKTTWNEKGLTYQQIAMTPFNFLTMPSSILVELPGIKINSYDGQRGTRRNIIAVIPNRGLTMGSSIEFSTENPIMLDIDNAYDISLRSLRVRVLNGDDSDQLLDVTDRIEATFLIS